MGRRDRDLLTPFVGIVTFLAGVVLLGTTFGVAYRMFSIPPAELLGVNPSQPLDVNGALTALVTLVAKIGLMLVMCLAGSMVASRGIKLYAATRIPPRKDSGSGSDEA